VDAAAGQGVQDGGQRRHQGLPFPGGHLGDLALVEDHPTHELDVEVPHAETPPPRFPHHGEDLGQDLVQLLPVLDPLPEVAGSLAQLVVRQPAEVGLEGIDGGDSRPESLDVAVVLGAEELAKDEVDHPSTF
jgi:hypothetical protein